MTGIRRDHPRSRGVYLMPVFMLSKAVGSSPLARGLHGERAGDDLARGIIPARAGFTTSNLKETQNTEDHPRSRGVYLAANPYSAAPGGSSPLARGLHREGLTRLFRGGIIPARAGFTPGHPHDDETMPDHPRSRGVYRPTEIEVKYCEGSSPLARGLQWGRDGPAAVLGIIPARAGFTITQRGC